MLTLPINTAGMLLVWSAPNTEMDMCPEQRTANMDPNMARKTNASPWFPL